MQQQDRGLTENLRAVFARFRQDPLKRFTVKLRQERAKQLRSLLSNPAAIDLATFNSEVWRLETRTHLRGKEIGKSIFEAPNSESVKELEDALNSGELGLQGNYMWRPGSSVYAPQLTDNDQKLENIWQALRTLNDQALTPLDKAQIIEGVSGFGRNIATGLVMVFHPTEFAIYNQQSQGALEILGYAVTRLETFESVAQRLRQELNAEDFLELDWFLYLINQGDIRLGNKPRAWWVNQGSTYEQERDGGYLWAPRSSADGKTLEHWTNLTRLEPKDIVLHYAKGALRAASQVLEPAVDASKPDGFPNGSWSSDGYLVRVAYQELAEPIRLQTIPREWRTAEAGPFTQGGEVTQTYLSPISRKYSWQLLGGFGDFLPDFVHALYSTWCIYVPHRAAENFELARAQQVWGSEDKNRFKDIEAGDHLLLVHDLTSDLSPPPRGFPRVDLPKFRGTARLLVRGVVTSQPYHDSSTVWPDKLYPYRFRFRETDAQRDALFSAEVLSLEVVDAVRRSAISQGRPVLVHTSVAKTGGEGENDVVDRGPLNVILYGPPGTGKTYSVQRRALRIIDPKLAAAPDDEVSEQYRRYLRQGRIEFLTFHPTYSYEEFVEGYRYDEATKVPTLHDGVFKNLVDRAVNPRQGPAVTVGARIWKVSLGRPSEPQIVSRCIANNEIGVGWLGDHDLTGMGREDIEELFEGGDGGSKAVNNINSVNYLINEIRVGDYIAVFRNQKEIQAIGVVTGEYSYKGENDSVFPHTRPVEWLDQQVRDIYEMNGSTNLTRSTIYPLDRISLQDFVELLPDHQRTEEPYVLIIDEINRGNLSRIFGELITLFEPDKRRGSQNELVVRLPYSQQPFTVPPNLYVIGTMNTADRSIALVDVALRRRFEFEEMMPDVTVIRRALSVKIAKATSPDLTEQQIDLICHFFLVLNKRIVVLLDRDHQVGHSYFLDVTSMDRLHQVLYHRVFPLLQEYFYNDWESLRRVLGTFDAQAKNKGFVESLDNEYKHVFGEQAPGYETPYGLHQYGVDELETALRNTFGDP